VNKQDSLSFYAQQFANSISSLSDFEIPKALTRYDTIGPVLVDAILQAGVNYNSVVAPRVRGVIQRYSDACIDTPSFLSLLRSRTSEEVLSWRDSEKPRRLLDLTEWLVARDVWTIGDLRDWLSCDSRAETLSVIKGIGSKTIDYLKNLVGIPTVAVDRHIRRFIVSAGIPITDYSEIRTVVCLAAQFLATQPDYLDHAIWMYVSRAPKRRHSGTEPSSSTASWKAHVEFPSQRLLRCAINSGHPSWRVTPLLIDEISSAPIGLTP